MKNDAAARTTTGGILRYKDGGRRDNGYCDIRAFSIMLNENFWPLTNNFSGECNGKTQMDYLRQVFVKQLRITPRNIIRTPIEYVKMSIFKH